MRMRVAAATGAVAVALALQPVFGRTAPQEKPSTAPNASAKSSNTGAQSPPAETEPAQKPAEPESTIEAQQPAVSPVTLSMVPRNPKLVTRLQEMLPDGTTVQQAAVGFRSQGQFIAAVYVAHRLEISFQELKQKVVRDRMSLGQAIHSLSPDADVARELARAREFAERQ